MQNYRHLKHFIDETGMLQFSLLDKPDAESGYTLDDNARALIVALLSDFEYEEVLKLTLFLHKSQQQDGSWSNFYHNGLYLSRFDSEDSIGRAILACCIGTASKWNHIQSLCEEMLINNLDKLLKFNSPRAIAYSLTGLCNVGKQSKKSFYNPLIEKLSSCLLALYTSCHGPRWYWYENYLTYCNGILPQAMLAVYNYNGNKKALKIGRDSLDFLCGILFRQGYLNIIGNQGWYQRGQRIPLFDQQPVDAASIICALHEGYKAIGNGEYLELARKGYNWYLGDNIHSLRMYNPQTGGCYDALTPEGVNENQGAEAVLSLLLTELTIGQYLISNDISS